MLINGSLCFIKFLKGPMLPLVAYVHQLCY
jgi:hypothetical protein